MTRSQDSSLPPDSASVSRVVGLVDYQDDGIVSRQILKTAGGNVTVFAFTEGQELSEHTSPFDALVQVLEGEATISLAGRPHSVQAGEMLLLPAHVPHAVAAVTRFKMLLTLVRS